MSFWKAGTVAEAHRQILFALAIAIMVITADTVIGRPLGAWAGAIAFLLAFFSLFSLWHARRLEKEEK